MLQKLKLFILDDTVYISLLIILVSVCSFAIGRISVLQTTNLVNKGQFSLKSLNFDGKLATTSSLFTATTSKTGLENSLKPVAPTSDFSGVTTKSVSSDVKYVASKSGTKYQILTCPGAKTIKETNKIYFSSIKEAESAGYVKASNCPGL